MLTAVCTAAAVLSACTAARWYLCRTSRRETSRWGGRVRLTELWNQGAAFGLPIGRRTLRETPEMPEQMRGFSALRPVARGELDVCALGRVARAVFRAGKRPSPTAVHGIPADSGARLHASGGLYRLCTVPGVGPRRSVPDAASDVHARHFRPVDVCTGTDGAVGLAGAGGRRGRFHAGDPLAAEAASGAAV